MRFLLAFRPSMDRLPGSMFQPFSASMISVYRDGVCALVTHIRTTLSSCNIAPVPPIEFCAQKALHLTSELLIRPSHGRLPILRRHRCLNINFYMASDYCSEKYSNFAAFPFGMISCCECLYYPRSEATTVMASALECCYFHSPCHQILPHLAARNCPQSPP